MLKQIYKSILRNSSNLNIPRAETIKLIKQRVKSNSLTASRYCRHSNLEEKLLLNYDYYLKSLIRYKNLCDIYYNNKEISTKKMADRMGFTLPKQAQ